MPALLPPAASSGCKCDDTTCLLLVTGCILGNALCSLLLIKTMQRSITCEASLLVTFVQTQTMLCPKCTIPCQKTRGCDHVRCTYCKLDFNYQDPAQRANANARQEMIQQNMQPFQEAFEQHLVCASTS